MKPVTLLLASLALVSCSNSHHEEKKIQEQNIALVKKVYEHFNNYEWTKMAELYADPAEYKDPSLGVEPVRQSRQQVIEKYSAYQRLSPDIKDSLVTIYPSGTSQVITEFISTGTTAGGIKWKLPICTIFTIENGLIIRDNNYYDKQ